MSMIIKGKKIEVPRRLTMATDLRYAHHVGFGAVGRVALEGHGDEGVRVDVLAGDVEVALSMCAAGEWAGRGGDA